MTAEPGTITSLLHRARNGDAGATDALIERVYGELKVVALGHIARSRQRANLDATNLVHAAFEQLLKRERLGAEDRRHFFFLFGRAMRDVLVDEARREDAAKRGGGRRRVPLADFTLDGSTDRWGFIDLHEALTALSVVDPDGARVAELRYFGGRSLEETAEIMGCSVFRVRDHWKYARAWLAERLGDST